MGYQERYFRDAGGDAYFDRNKAEQNAPREIPGLSTALRAWALALALEKSEPGSLCVFGGASGSEAAYLASILEGWKVVNVDISDTAIRYGRTIFPDLLHFTASLTEKNLVDKLGDFDCVVLTGILCWIDRSLLSRAVLNVHELVKDGGYLGIYDFFPPFPRRNAMAHAEHVYTYKQDYADLFESLGVFRLVAKSFSANQDPNYPVEDQLLGYSVLEKIRL